MKETIKKMASLARLKFPEAELDRFTKKSEHILEYIERLDEIDTTKMEATSHAIEVVNAFREDQTQKFEGFGKILDLAPARTKNLFEVPKVIDED